MIVLISVHVTSQDMGWRGMFSLFFLSRPSQGHIPAYCPHNGSGRVVFASPEAVREILTKAILKPLRGVHRNMGYMMYMDVGHKGVLK